MGRDESTGEDGRGRNEDVENQMDVWYYKNEISGQKVTE